MNIELGNWLAGYIDAKGHFSIRPSGACKFKLYTPLTVLIQDLAGFGTTHLHKTGQWSWEVQSKNDCQSLIEVLDLYSLRSPKQTEYLVWRRAVVFWNYDDGGIDRRQAVEFLRERLNDVRLT